MGDKGLNKKDLELATGVRITYRKILWKNCVFEGIGGGVKTVRNRELSGTPDV